MIDRNAPLGGLDSEHWISVPEAVAFIKQLRPKAKDSAVRKLILGALIHSSDSRLEAIAVSFREEFHRIERNPPTSYKAPTAHKEVIYPDFWRIGMAWDEYADHAFATGDFIFIGEMTQSELPYRLRDSDTTLGSERVRLFQEARGVSVGRTVLGALVRDRQWRQWGEILDAVTNKGRRGKARMWKWDEVAAALAMEASAHPAILREGPGPIVRFINDEMRRLHFDDVPDQGDVYRFAQLFSRMWVSDAPAAPASPMT